MRRSKKAISTYLSWILIFAFMIFVSTMMYQVLIGQVEGQTDKLEKRVEETNCEDVGFSINSYCQDEYSMLMNLTNSKTRKIESIRLTLFDIYDTPFQITKDISLVPGEQEEIAVLKHGTLIQAEMIPIIDDGNGEVSCVSSKLTLNSIDFCS